MLFLGIASVSFSFPLKYFLAINLLVSSCVFLLTLKNVIKLGVSTHEEEERKTGECLKLKKKFGDSNH